MIVSFGPGRRRIAPILAAWIVLVLAISIGVAIDLRHGGDLYARVALIPAEVWRGQLWRLVTWALVELDPKALLFGCVGIYWFGGELLATWGRRRFARTFGGIAIGAAAGTSIAALGLGAAHHLYFGGWALGDALVVAWGLTFPSRLIRVYLVIELDGETLAYATTAITVLSALLWGLAPVLPALLAVGAAFVVAGGLGPRGRRRFGVMRGGRREHGPYAVN